MLGSPIEEFCFQLAEQLASCLKIKSWPEVLSNLRVESQQQLVVEFIIEINEYDYQAPLMEFQYSVNEMPSSKILLKLPVP